MKTILTILFTFLISLGALEDKAKTFNDNCQEGYNTYVTYQEIDNETYYLNIKLGEVKGSIGYSICFLSSEANQYDLKIISKGKTNSFVEDERGDYLIYFLQINDINSLGIYFNNTLTKTIDLKSISLDEYNTLYGASLSTGSGIGFANSRNYDSPTTLTMILSIVFAVIIILSIIVIIILSVTKKGWFNQENRTKQATITPNFRRSIDEVEVVEETTEEEPKEVKEEKEEVKEEKEEPKEVYQKTHYYDDEERDISKLLQDKGFNTNYQDLSMDEKNKVMLELMRMKDFKEITNEEYRSEVIKLWS